MAAAAQIAVERAGEESPFQWFWSYLKRELAPYPGRGWTVARMTIAAAIVMLLIMVFRLPNAALGSYYTLLLSRENPRATLRSAVSVLGAVATALLFLLCTAVLLAGSPLLHFSWVALTLFVTFFLIDALSEYRMGTAFGFLAVSTVTAWDFPANTNTLVETTLWTALAVSTGALTTVIVEYVSFRIHPQDQVTDGIADRLRVVELTLQGLANERKVPDNAREKIEQYAMTGTALLRRGILRADMDLQRKQQMSAIVALTGRLVDLCANARTPPGNETEKVSYLEAAASLSSIRASLHAKHLTAVERLPAQTGPTDNGSFLANLQMTISEIPRIIAGLERRPEYFPSAVDVNVEPRLFKQGAFANGGSLRFALRGTLAAMACYIVYNGVAWAGLATSVSTCMITALSNVGSSRQKQFLRVSGTILGGVVIGMTAQVILIPYMDGIASFTLLFCIVTAISSWIATSTPRLSYAGVQTAFAFYVTHLRVFAPQTSLSVARDDVMGILLGLLSMWLLFDTIWAKDAATEMAELFVGNLRRIAAFHSFVPEDGLAAAINKSRVERAAINNNFDQIRNLGDSVVFEFGPNRSRNMELRQVVRALQPQLRAYFLLEISLLHYQLELDAEPVGSECRENIDRAEKLLSLLATQAEQDWSILSAAGGRKSPAVRHDDALPALIERCERDLEGPDSQPGNDEAGNSISLSRWILAAALALSKSMLRLEEEAFRPKKVSMYRKLTTSPRRT